MPTLHPRRELEPLIQHATPPDLSHNYCQLIGLLHRALAADKATRTVFPKPFEFTSQEDKLFEAIQYWEAAWYMLTCLSGWTNTSRGLRWFYDNDKNTEGDERLELLNTIWNSEGQLDIWARWIWDDAGQTMNPDTLRRTLGGKSNYPWSPQAIPTTPAWEKEVERKFLPMHQAGVPLPFYGGGNPLHLGHSLALISQDDGNTHTLTFDKPSRRAALVLDRFQGWPAALATAGDSLPALGDHSWHVDVVVKPLGWLGTFRRSRDTGLWFQGKHSIHLAGQ